MSFRCTIYQMVLESHVRTHEPKVSLHLLVLVKIEEEMHYCIFAHHDCSLVNVYHRIIGGVNDPYGVKVI